MAVVWRAVGAACTWLCQKAQSGTIPLTVGDTPTMRSAMLPSPISADAPSEGPNMRRPEFDKTALNFLAAVHLTPTANPHQAATRAATLVLEKPGYRAKTGPDVEIG